eukprot:g11702.t1
MAQNYLVPVKLTKAAIRNVQCAYSSAVSKSVCTVFLDILLGNPSSSPKTYYSIAQGVCEMYSILPTLLFHVPSATFSLYSGPLPSPETQISSTSPNFSPWSGKGNERLLWAHQETSKDKDGGSDGGGA